MKRLMLLLPAVLLVGSVSVIQADTIHVPGDLPTIQAGIDVSVNGDTVLVADGIYSGYGNYDIDFLGKAIVMMSENGADSCIVDCNGEGHGFYFHNGEEFDSVLQGFTIHSGLAELGGGILCESSPTIIGNTIKGNTADYGGGIHCSNYSSPRILGNIVYGNTANMWGGGIRCSRSSATIKKNLIVANSSNVIHYGGGGIYCNNSPEPNIDGNTITGNRAEGDGGGMFCNYASPMITNSIIWDNGQSEIDVRASSPIITYCDIKGGWQGEGNIDTDPLFVDPENENYHLMSASPCIDTGDPASPFDPDSTRADMGVYYFHQIVLTLDAVGDTTHYQKGDTLGFTVTVTNLQDTTVFLQGWTELLTPDSTHISPLLEPINGVIGAQDTVVAHITQYIPYNAPFGGPYEYMVKVGQYPNVVWAEDSFELFVISPDILVEVVPDTTHYHRGEMLGFTATATNNEDTTVYLDGWSEGITPWGELITPLLGPVEFEMGAGVSISDYYQQKIPVEAPFGGPYIYRVETGIYDSQVFGEDHFEFYIVPGPSER